jgi:long-subunit acyl-CoA synthetase (AMP-forming)
MFLSFYYLKGELSHALSISKPKFLFVSKIAGGNVLSVAKKLTFIEKIILIDEDNVDNGKLISLKTFVKKFESTTFDIEKFVQQPVKLNEQVAVIFMSSGTTGLPKGSDLFYIK